MNLQDVVLGWGYPIRLVNRDFDALGDVDDSPAPGSVRGADKFVWPGLDRTQAAGMLEVATTARLGSISLCCVSTALVLVLCVPGAQ
jgi:hypothetical protein